jgi:hypothetical protein
MHKTGVTGFVGVVEKDYGKRRLNVETKGNDPLLMLFLH